MIVFILVLAIAAVWVFVSVAKSMLDDTYLEVRAPKQPPHRKTKP